MSEYMGIAYLKNKLNARRDRVLLRYKYYEMKNKVQELDIVIPKKFRCYSECLGWCGKAVDSLADRLCFREFRNDNFDLNTIFQMNNSDVLFDSAILSALISSCCFIYISPDETDYPRLQVIDGGNATGIIDPITGMLTEGYAVLQRDNVQNPILEAYFTAEETDVYQNGVLTDVYDNIAPAPLLVPIIYRPDAVRAFGHSRISRACMEIQQGALRTITRSEISAEFYSFPQKYVVGLDPESELDKAQATISSFIRIDKDPDGDHPVIGQFQQQSMTPYNEQLKMFASLFAGESGLTMDDLGFATENPSSAEAIKASHENLRLSARKAQRDFASGFLNAGYLAACVRDHVPYQRQQLYQTKAAWEPVFEPDAASLSGIGDGAIKLNQAVPGFIGPENLRDLTGLEADDYEEGESYEG